MTRNWAVWALLGLSAGIGIWFALLLLATLPTAISDSKAAHSLMELLMQIALGPGLPLARHWPMGVGEQNATEFMAFLTWPISALLWGIGGAILGLIWRAIHLRWTGR